VKTEIVRDPQAWAHSLGGLHDLGIASLKIDVDNGRVEFEVDDLNINEEGSPGYEPRPCTLVFERVRKFGADCDLTESLYIAKAEIRDGFEAVFLIAGRVGPYEGKYPSIRLQFEDLGIRDRAKDVG
jgi:hypothetical protein